MVSLPAQEERKPSSNLGASLAKKRKWHEGGGGGAEEFTREFKLRKEDDRYRANNSLELDAPLPLEWQRCLDNKSGEIHFYNTRTQKRTSKDPRRGPEPKSPGPGLDLELNLNLTAKHAEERKREEEEGNSKADSWCSSSSSTPSWISLDIDGEEMVAAVCMKCHMLVMMCKDSPSCPNCKFVHPRGHSSSSLLVKPRCRLLC